MTIARMREQIRDLDAQLTEARNDAQRVASDDSATLAQIQDATTRVQTLRARINALCSELADADAAGATGATPTDSGTAQRSLRDILGSREYARAFASAVRNGIKPRTGGGSDEYRILYDALTIAGNSGADGGYLVPADMDTQIHELMRDMRPLRELVSVEQVSANTGWRVIDTAPTSGFTALSSEMPSGGVPTDDQPEFKRVNYSLATYGLRIPISSELLADETAGLISYLSRYFAKKLVLTEDKLILTELDKLSPATITPGATGGDTLALIKRILNVALDPAISGVAQIVTNQSGYDYLDSLTDTSGRPLIQPDPTTRTPQMLGGHRIIIVSDALLPNRVSSGNYYPLYVGAGGQYMTLFERSPLEVASTDIGGDAWASNATEVRGIVRLGTAVFDQSAMVKREIYMAE